MHYVKSRRKFFNIEVTTVISELLSDEEHKRQFHGGLGRNYLGG
jgi:hypothetical protein